MRSEQGHVADLSQNTARFFVEERLRAGEKPNRLINEKSPYLLQHAFNPVDWYPWGDEAFETARREDKPAFLSIGYSTCHWCHVMARESFEDLAIADRLNRHFISIKVDREERPDIDRIYMALAQIMAGAGGWPLSLFLTPDRAPLYAGTYFPPDSRFGRLGFPDLLEAVHRAWIEERGQLTNAAREAVSHLHVPTATGADTGLFSSALLSKTQAEFERYFDEMNGGFGDAPKFPRPVELRFLIRHYHVAKQQRALDMVLAALRAMARGGIHDQLGGGFHRYSVDAQWRVPHFEKMLYDQAQLAIVYLEAFQVTGDEFYSAIGARTLDYVLRELQSPEGGFHSAEDADSPLPRDPHRHGEGVYYLWTAPEIRDALGEQDARHFSFRFGVEENGNALSDPHGEFGNGNILYEAHTAEQTAIQFGLDRKETALRLEQARLELFDLRRTRPHPHLDDKIVTAWNGLAISAFAAGYRALGEQRYREAAQRAGNFVASHLYDEPAGTLYRRFREAEAGLDGQLQDYACVIQAYLDLYECTFDPRWFERALALQETQVDLFWDAAGSGFFETAAGAAGLIARLKEDYDGAEPSGNSVSVLNLVRLGSITGRQQWLQMARSTVECFSSRLHRTPTAMPLMAAGVGYIIAAKRQIIITGKKDDPVTRRMTNVIHRRFLPHDVIIFADDANRPVFSRYMPPINELGREDGRPAAYVCVDYSCRLPLSDPGKLDQLLSG